MSAYQKRKKEEEVQKPQSVDPLIAIKTLVKQAPTFNPNATAKDVGEFSATYAEWLSNLKRAVE